MGRVEKKVFEFNLVFFFLSLFHSPPYLVYTYRVETVVTGGSLKKGSFVTDR